MTIIFDTEVQQNFLSCKKRHFFGRQRDANDAIPFYKIKKNDQTFFMIWKIVSAEISLNQISLNVS